MIREGTVERTFAWSMTILVSLASLILAFAEESQFPTAFTPLVAILSHVLVDRWKSIRLPLVATNCLGIAAFAVMVSEFTGATVLQKLDCRRSSAGVHDVGCAVHAQRHAAILVSSLL